MRQRTLGDVNVTMVGVGELRLATSDARGLPARDVERALHRALELGITFVDCSEEADAEKLAGDAVRALRLRDTVVVATQVPVLAERPGAPRRDVLPERLPARYVQERVEASLRASRLDGLPLAVLPVRLPWLASPAWPEVAGTCHRLVREGKVLRWAAALDALGEDDDPAALGEPFVALAVRCSACTRDERLLAHALPVLAREPLAGGALAGALGPGVKLPPRDDRHALDAAALERIAVACARLAPLVKHEPPAARSSDAARAALERAARVPHREAATLAELALRYVIDRGAIALPRLHRVEHVPEAIAAAAAPPLSPDVRAAIEAVFS